MSLYSVLRPILFRLDPERAHELAFTAMRAGLAKGGGCVTHPYEAFGLTFPNRLGLAAGFDKNAEGLHIWRRFGFGFAEIGTVTRHAQPGNPRPRMFRLPESEALINRLGFNNEGADAIRSRLEQRPSDLIVGLNIGKSKITELDEAPEDYAYSFRHLSPLADYVTVNVSSPNTPGLRSLQDREPLTRILWRLREINGTIPLFVKIAPDLEDAAVEDVAQLVDELDLTGIVATNTTISRSVLPTDPQIEGGLSGRPLAARASDVLRLLRATLPKERHVISVGGIHNEEEARARIAAGASLIQVYTGWVYGGPDFPARIAHAVTTEVAAG
ncbi:MAG: quinone-dependent dihydroorotate dehydrogenase [Fimbriimonadaceae bacterium]|nr:quinone-dependent dihydroorotate dehydrogenase [Fimbriimonadaceae bacterium]